MAGIYDEMMSIARLRIEPLTRKNWDEFVRLEKSLVHKRIDDKEVWSIPCIFIDKKFRRSGISAGLLRGAVRYAEDNGITILEAYPVIPAHDKLPDAFAWIGLFSSFKQTGFEIVDRKSRNRPMVRYYIDKNSAKVNNNPK